jgi:hypothetical protein
MEIDATPTDMEDFFIHPTQKYSLERAKFYPFKQGKKIVYILPLNRLIGYNVDTILAKIRKIFGTKYFDPSLVSKPSDLQQKALQLTPLALSELFYDFLKRKQVTPIEVVKVYEINEPSPLNVNRPSVMGLETATIKQTLRYVDHIYRPINGKEKIALSIFFKYDHIPVVVTL